MLFSPRLNQILLLLLSADSPIPAATLANRLKISKRTIFRELENLDIKMKKFDLILETKSKRGISISGTQDNKKTLSDMLISSEYVGPKNIEERQKLLILELLKQDEPQKIYFFSVLLQVSESTVNHDLESAEKWFSQNDIQLVKKPGIGVYLTYKEENYRKACMRYVHRNMHESLTVLYQIVKQEIVDSVTESVKQIGGKKLDNMAEFSYIGLFIYLSIGLKRVLESKILGDCREISPEETSTEDYLFAVAVAHGLERRFHVHYPPIEINQLYIYIKGASLQHANKDCLVDGYFDLQCMVYDMIHQYDVSIAFQLKNDDELVTGLIAHLNPTIIRLQNGFEIHNPFQMEVLSQYPDIFAKSRRAAGVLEETLHCQIPDEEIGLLALHFGGASVRLKNNAKYSRKTNLGVVCASGIGISALLSSRLLHIFHDKVKVRCLSLSDLETNDMKGIDLLISTLALPLPQDTYVYVNPMLTEKDILHIAEKMEALDVNNQIPNESTGENIIEQVDEIRLVSSEISSILKSYHLYYIDDDDSVGFDGLVKKVSELTSESGFDRIGVYSALMKRESLSTQIIPEYEIVFLHAKMPYIKESLFILLRPRSGTFSNLRLAVIKAVIVMLIPEDDLRPMLAISSISREVFESEIFLEMIKYGEEQQIKQYVEKILSCYLVECMSNFRL